VDHRDDDESIKEEAQQAPAPGATAAPDQQAAPEPKK